MKEENIQKKVEDLEKRIEAMADQPKDYNFDGDPLAKAMFCRSGGWKAHRRRGRESCIPEGLKKIVLSSAQCDDDKGK